MKKKDLRIKQVGAIVLLIAIALMTAACTRNNASLPNVTDRAMLPAVTDPWISGEIIPETANRSVTNNIEPYTATNVEPVSTKSPTSGATPSTTSNARSGGEESSVRVGNVKKIAMDQKGVKNAAVIMSDNNNVLVAVELEENTKKLSSSAKAAIIKAAGSNVVTRITTDVGHFAAVHGLETANNGALVLHDRIKEIWDAIK